MSDTLLWWIALGYDSPRMIAEAMKNVGTEPDKIVGYLEQAQGISRASTATSSFTPTSTTAIRTARS